MNVQQIVNILLINLPAYVLLGMALWKKIRDREYYAASVFGALCVLLVAEAVLMSQVLYADTCTPVMMKWQAGVTVLIMPLLYMFHAPEGGEERVNRTTVILYLLTLLLLLPPVSWEVVPSYAITTYSPPRDILGISIFYKGRYIYYLSWTAIVLTLQSWVALRNLKRTYRAVAHQGARYSLKAKWVLFWDLSCGYFLSTFLLLPVSLWQNPAMRWSFYVLAAAFIGIGSLLIVLGFDVNPIVDHRYENGMSLNDFMLENGELVSSMKVLLEEGQVYLEQGIQSDVVAERLGTTHAYFLKMMEAVYGESFPEWVNRQRIAHAETLLSAGEMPLESVARQSGYSDAYSFSRMYERITGKRIVNSE